MCCGEIKDIIAKTSGIVAGFGSLWIESFFKLPPDRCPATVARTRTCQRCDKNTWLTIGEFVAWAKEQGLLKVARNFTDPTKLPDLPASEYKKRAKLLCRLCKCFIPAKVRSADEHCPIGKW